MKNLGNNNNGWFKDASWEEEEYDRDGRFLKRLVNNLFHQRINSVSNVAMRMMAHVPSYQVQQKEKKNRRMLQQLTSCKDYQMRDSLMEEFLQLSNSCASETLYEQFQCLNEEIICSKLACSLGFNNVITSADIIEEETPRRDLCSRICEIVNTKGLAAVKSILGNTVVPEGMIKVISHNGRVEVAGPGRYLKLNPRAHWESTFSLDKDLIEFETLQIIRIPKGYYGLVEQNGVPSIHSEGILVRNTVLFTFINIVKVDQVHIKHKNLHILRIPQGQYGKVIENNEWKLLTQGIYTINNVFFQFCGLESIDTPHIQHGSLNIIRVPKSSVGLISIGTKPLILPEGIYYFNDPTVIFNQFVSAESRIIELSPRIRFRVNSGEIALAWMNCKPLFIEKPGVYDMDSTQFQFVTFVPATQKTIRLGSSLRVIVQESQIAVTYKNGVLDILPCGTYMFEDAERVMVSFLTTQIISTPLQSGSEWLLCDTRDFVQVGMRASVSFRVSNPRLALLKMGKGSEITDLIKKFSIASLQSIIRGTPLNLIVQNQTTSVEGENIWEIPEPFFDTFHDQFMSNVYHAFKHEYGISIENIRVQDFAVMDAKIAHTIANKVLLSTNNANQLANLAAQHVIDVTIQDIKSSIESMKSSSEALQQRIQVEAKCESSLKQVEAEAEAIIKIAKAKADARIYQAEAEAKSIELKALAHKKRAEYISSTEFGVQDALLSIHHDMVVECMKNVSQVVYLPSDKNMGNLPIQLFGLKGEIPTFDSLTNISKCSI